MQATQFFRSKHVLLEHFEHCSIQRTISFHIQENTHKRELCSENFEHRERKREIVLYSLRIYRLRKKLGFERERVSRYF